MAGTGAGCQSGPPRRRLIVISSGEVKMRGSHLRGVVSRFLKIFVIMLPKCVAVSKPYYRLVIVHNVACFFGCLTLLGTVGGLRRTRSILGSANTGEPLRTWDVLCSRWGSRHNEMLQKVALLAANLP